jgi:hypothetical protein
MGPTARAGVGAAILPDARATAGRERRIGNSGALAVERRGDNYIMALQS